MGTLGTLEASSSRCCCKELRRAGPIYSGRLSLSLGAGFSPIPGLLIALGIGSCLITATEHSLYIKYISLSHAETFKSRHWLYAVKRKLLMIPEYYLLRYY